MRRRRREEESKGEQSWLLTYSDVITLVLCMFVMLYSFSTIDIQKFEALVQSLNQTFSGVLDGGQIIDPDNKDNLPIDVDDKHDEEDKDNDLDKDDELNTEDFDKELLEVYEKILNLIIEHGLEDQVFVGVESKGIEIRFNDGVFFDSGSAALKSSANQMLNKLAKIFKKIDNEILVEGHTDNRPINTPQFPSNWELSTSRAISVVKYFVNQGIDPTRIGALGFGEYRPIETNGTAQGRQANRRVNVIVLRMAED